jgi:hypothetical protein
VPLFTWIGALGIGWRLGAMLKDELERFDEDVEGEHFGVHVSKADIELANLLTYRAESDREAEAKVERSRWLEEHRAERSFPCGIVPDPVLEATQPKSPAGGPARELLPSDPGWAAPERPVTETAVPPDPRPLTPLRPMQVIAAVLPDDVAFIREFGDDEEVDEVGRLPRNAIRELDVIDSSGAHIPQPIKETLEPPRLAWTVLRWTNQCAPDEERFAFRSPWMAWRAARHLLAAKQG